MNFHYRWFHRFILAVAAAAVGAGVASAGTINGKVVSVADGDTITVLTAGKVQVKVRLAGIDAPEAGQEYGQKSKEALAAMVAGRPITVTEDGKDRYGRVIGWIQSGEIDANRAMVRGGWAWHFTQFNKDAGIALLQREAKESRRGLWAAPNPPMAPWDYRALKRGVPANPKPTAQKPSLGGDYWINSNGVRHNSACRWFGKTKRGHYGTKDEGKGCGDCGG